MAVVLFPFEVDLATYVNPVASFTTNINSDFRLGFLAMQVLEESVNLSTNIASDSPVTHGIQEPFAIWLVSSEGVDYNTRLFAGNFNGKQSIVWTPSSGQNFIFNQGSELRIDIGNRSRFGHVFGNLTVETL